MRDDKWSRKIKKKKEQKTRRWRRFEKQGYVLIVVSSFNPSFLFFFSYWANREQGLTWRSFDSEKVKGGEIKIYLDDKDKRWGWKMYMLMCLWWWSSSCFHVCILFSSDQWLTVFQFGGGKLSSLNHWIKFIHQNCYLRSIHWTNNNLSSLEFPGLQSNHQLAIKSRVKILLLQNRPHLMLSLSRSLLLISIHPWPAREEWNS